MGRAFVLAASALLAGCSACEAIGTLAESADSFTELPASVDEVREWAPDGASVDQHRIERSSGGGGACGHSPVCIILLPVLIGDALTPPLYDLVTVTQDDRVLYQGMFDLRGRVVHARLRDGERWRVIQRLPLDELGEHPIVELERIAIAADGADGESERVPILPQVDLALQYREAIDGESSAEQRGELIAEALTWLKSEIVPYVVERAESTAMNDEERALVYPRLEHTSDADAQRLFDALVSRPGPRLANAVFFSQRELSAETADALTGSVGAALCEGPPDRSWAPVLTTERFVVHRDAALARARRCTPASRATLVRAYLDDALEDRELAQALAADREATRWVPDLVGQRRAVAFMLLSEHPVAADPGLYRAVIELPMLRERGLNEEEGRALAVAYLHERATSYERWAVFEILRLAANPHADEGARTAWNAALGGTEGEARARIAAALVVVNDREHAHDALRHIAPRASLAYQHGSFVHVEPTLSQLLASPFLSAGCSEPEIHALARASQGGATPGLCGSLAAAPP
jgi:hypothetical protein